MKFNLDQNENFFVEYTTCNRPIGNIRQELEAACKKLANENKILICLSTGLDSQVLLHTFHTLGLPYECAFKYHPGYNDIEYERLKFLEKKYNFKAIVVTIDVDSCKDEIEQRSSDMGISPEHHIMKIFVEQLPSDKGLLLGLDGPDFVFDNKQCYCLESWNSIPITRFRFLSQIKRTGKILTVDRCYEFNEFSLACLVDPIVNAYLTSLPYILRNDLVDSKTGKKPHIPFHWDYYVKPLILGKYWKDELEYFPKFASEKEIDWIGNPKLRHDYLGKSVYINRRELIQHLSSCTGAVVRWTQKS